MLWYTGSRVNTWVDVHISHSFIRMKIDNLTSVRLFIQNCMNFLRNGNGKCMHCRHPKDQIHVVLEQVCEDDFFRGILGLDCIVFLKLHQLNDGIQNSEPRINSLIHIDSRISVLVGFLVCLLCRTGTHRTHIAME